MSYLLLKIFQNSKLLKTKIFTDDQISIGSSEGLSLHLPELSPWHLLIEKKQTVFSILDLNSETGTFVNGIQITEESLLKSGDKIKVGPYELHFFIGAQQMGKTHAGPSAPPQPPQFESTHAGPSAPPQPPQVDPTHAGPSAPPQPPQVDPTHAGPSAPPQPPQFESTPAGPSAPPQPPQFESTRLRLNRRNATPGPSAPPQPPQFDPTHAGPSAPPQLLRGRRLRLNRRNLSQLMQGSQLHQSRRKLSRLLQGMLLIYLIILSFQTAITKHPNQKKKVFGTLTLQQVKLKT